VRSYAEDLSTLRITGIQLIGLGEAAALGPLKGMHARSVGQVHTRAVFAQLQRGTQGLSYRFKTASSKPRTRRAL
jgi:hypothetical protein